MAAMTTLRRLNVLVKSDNCIIKYYSTKSSLKSFYLFVHPDLFSAYPKEKKVNEESLKIFHAYLDALENKQPLYNATLTFYKKNTDINGNDLHSEVKVVLKAHTKNDAINELLRSFNLLPAASKSSYSNIQNISSEDQLRGWGNRLHIFDGNKHQYSNLMGDLRFGKFSVDTKTTLSQWLDKNAAAATEKKNKSRALQISTKQSLQRLKEKYGVVGLSKDSTVYTYATINSALKQLESLLDREFRGIDHLNGRMLSLNNFNGLDQFGRFLINVNDVPEDWKQALWQVEELSHFQASIGSIEKVLSKSCFDIKFIRPRSSSHPLAAYHQGLVSMMQNQQQDEYVNTTSSYTNITAAPEWYDDFAAISTEGYIKVPSLMSKRSLHSFCQNNYEEIKRSRKNYLKNLVKEHKALSECKENLTLYSIDKDYRVNTEQLVTACDRLLQYKHRSVFKDLILVLSNYYSVSNDGLMRIPWNFIQ